MSRWQRDCEACRRELEALVEDTAAGLERIQANHSKASSNDALPAKEIADLIDRQLGKVEQAQRIWVEPHAWKEGPRRMEPILQDIVDARQRIIAIAENTRSRMSH